VNPIGVHLALGGGDDKALAHAEWLGCSAVQIFTHSPQSFQFKPVDEPRLTQLRAGWKRLGIQTVVSHASYLINIAATENAKFHGAVAILRKELEYAAHYGCHYVVLHIGKHTTSTKEEGIAQVIKGIEKVADIFTTHDIMLLLEGAAGQGTEIGAVFAEIDAVIKGLSKETATHVGVCLDTCHLYASGHDIATQPKKIVQEIEKTFGIARVKVIHVNDSKFALGERKDRHEKLGQGHIGSDGLRAFLTQPDIKKLPMILETPFDDQKEQMADMDALRNILGR